MFLTSDRSLGRLNQYSIPISPSGEPALPVIPLRKKHLGPRRSPGTQGYGQGMPVGEYGNP